MNIIKNMEAIFVITLGLACSASYLVDALPEAKAGTNAVASVQNAAPEMAPSAVIVVPAKRMSAAEKEQSLEQDRQLARSHGEARSSI